ncbi:MAG: hypothetical protein AW07_02870 [Candidatus Accumulibacter sp. SK-11]|nr:MAG: hypothetical protein AW07_02870 [Candidatus Accumulibacter sp. SK-11]
MRLVDVGAAYREIPGIHLVDHAQVATAGDRRRLPGMLVELSQRYRLAAALGADRQYVSGKVADEVTAGDPRRQREALAFAGGLGQRAAHFEQVRCGLAGDDAVTNRCRLHLWTRAPAACNLREL